MLTVLRTPYESDNFWLRKEFQAWIGADFNNRNEPGWIRIQFSTNPDGVRKQIYQVFIHPTRFEDVAKYMLEADAETTIRAFGAAMKDFQSKTDES